MQLSNGLETSCNYQKTKNINIIKIIFFSFIIIFLILFLLIYKIICIYCLNLYLIYF